MSTTHVEIETIDQLHAAAPDLTGQVVQGVDLSGCRDLIRHCDVSTTIFLGCSIPVPLATWLRARGALIFPAIPGVPFDPYHPGAYTAKELYNSIGKGYDATLDAAIDRWRRGLATPPGLRDTLATALHDDAMTDALDDLLANTDPTMRVGVMGGHSVARGSEDYRLAANLGSALAATGYLVVTGRGPGAMEATNLGAACPPDALDESLSRLRAVVGIADVTAWVQAGLDVMSSWPNGPAHRTIGIPTWFYGHEPPNVFATSIIKYFSNALREDILLNRCQGGIIYLPGQAGTVQELFQALTGNYYATNEDEVTPLIMVGKHYWSHTVPAWPLLHSMSRDRPHHIRLVDTVEEAVAALRRHPSR
ncbi:lysine decarboxylase [Cutibacterium sp. WCA-380-WT-3A]|uniref:Lysine decarboxylase n=1 Tax=Cutibacterium porci TaxID=2605781 RepID=A0A7K0J9G8_9ACTN|nr:LOG family protein [Cutibacterium porci]MSS46510.1 lysine decarboxylase [Cutibacterium porci]